MYHGISGRRSLSEENLHASAQPRRNNVTLDKHSVKFERMADWQLHVSYVSHLTRQLELQRNQEQLNLRAEETVYQMFEERESWSDDISPVKSSVKKSPANPNVAEWSACALSGKKNVVSSMQDRGASVKEKKEIRRARYKMLVQVTHSLMNHASFR